MRELMQDLYSSGLKSVDICDAPISMEKYIQKLLDGFLKQVDDARRGE